MAEIWKARAEGPGGFEKILAIKVVLPSHAGDEDFLAMFVNEAKLVASLTHPNIVQVFDFGNVEAEYFIAMEYVAGANLATVARRLAEVQSRMPVEVALYIAAEIARGLGYAHAKRDEDGKPLRLVHRDVSASNILVSHEGEVKLSDFGIARMQSMAGRTAAGFVRGKLGYMSPEQAMGGGLDGRSDLFSLGAVLFEMLTGKKLHGGAQGTALHERVVRFEGVPAEEVGWLPTAIRNALTTALAPDPDDRFQSGVEMEAALSAPLGVEGIIQARGALASMVSRLVAQDEPQTGSTSTVVPESLPEPGPTVAVREADRGAHRPIAPTAISGQDGGGSDSAVKWTRPPAPAPAAAAAAEEAAEAGAGSASASVSANDPRGVIPGGGAELESMAPMPTRTVAADAPGTQTIERGAPVIERTRVSRDAPAFASDAAPPGGTARSKTSVWRLGLRPGTRGFGGTLVIGITSVLLAAGYGAVRLHEHLSPALTVGTPVPIDESDPTPEPTGGEAGLATDATAPPPTDTATPAEDGPATISVESWPSVEVWLDGERVSATTPATNIAAAPGPHTLRFVLKKTHYTQEYPVEIEAGKSLHLFVDVAHRSIDREDAP